MRARDKSYSTTKADPKAKWNKAFSVVLGQSLEIAEDKLESLPIYKEIFLTKNFAQLMSQLILLSYKH